MRKYSISFIRQMQFKPKLRELFSILRLANTKHRNWLPLGNLYREPLMTACG